MLGLEAETHISEPLMPAGFQFDLPRRGTQKRVKVKEVWKIFFPASSRGGRGSADSQTQQPWGGSLSPVSSGSTTSSSKVSKSVSRMLVPGPSQVSSFMLLLRAGQ